MINSSSNSRHTRKCTFQSAPTTSSSDHHCRLAKGPSMHSASSLPETLPKALRVMAIFPEGPHAPGKYWAFEYLIFLQANGSLATCKRAVTVLRSLHGDSEGLK